MSVEIAPGLPAQLPFGLGGVGHGDRGITAASFRDHVGDGLATGADKGLDHPEHGVTLAADEIQLQQLITAAQQGLQGSQMAFRQIDHMDVTPHAAAIGGEPVAAEHLHLLAPAHGHLADEGEQVVGDAVGVFADAATGMGSHRVEVTQGGNPPTRLAGDDITEHLPQRCFDVALGVDRPDSVRFQRSAPSRGSRRR